MQIKIGLALGGGGARGFSHIGVIRIMEKNNIPINQITGTSIGAIIGGLYAYFQDSVKVESFIGDLIKQQVFKELDLRIFISPEQGAFNHPLLRLKKIYTLIRTLKTRSIYSPEIIERIYEHFPDVKIEELSLPFATIATDLISGREIVINRGSLKKSYYGQRGHSRHFPTG